MWEQLADLSHRIDVAFPLTKPIGPLYGAEPGKRPFADSDDDNESSDAPTSDTDERPPVPTLLPLRKTLDFDGKGPILQERVNLQTSAVLALADTPTYQSDRFQIFDTVGRGKGVRVRPDPVEPILPGTFLMEYEGEHVSEAEGLRRQDEDYGDMVDSYVMFTAAGAIDATPLTAVRPWSMSRYVNHSRSRRNIFLRLYGKTGRAMMFALVKILPGEELLFDYGERDPEKLRANPWLAQ
jgi:hypothetical protein